MVPSLSMRFTRLVLPTKMVGFVQEIRSWRWVTLSFTASFRHSIICVQVMREDLRSVTHSLALHALRQTPNRVRLVIHREDDEIYEQMDVELVKKRDRGLGLSIVGKKSGPGVFISEVVKGGAADLDGRLVQVLGWQLLLC